ncbi:eukaryotic translation initiation factor 4 gamma 3-like [Hippoglossus hippoglossus]|uniref:eukaryotic translation initiation factor 4 gamma 3-like n=1 Tax=Hippoglossus hippoglossus TaxID=8267 RepID=UPI00148D3917|nr:eukaryotic translation initiation factor 4 gamma 3-like [Hippoglossus hippoglossus]
MYSSVLFLLPDDAPKLQPVVQKSSSPGLVQPEAPVETPEANTPETEPTPPASEPELPLPASLSTPVNLPLTAANSSDRPSARESASSHLSSVGEQKPSLAPPQPPNTDKPLLDAPRTLAALSVAAPKALNGLAESGTELETAAHEPSLMPPAALQPQASSPAYREASSETLPSDMRPQVPIAAALAPMAPVAVVPVTLSSSPAPALPIMLPRGLLPLVQATTEADEPSKSIDTKDLVPGAGTEAQGGITDSKTESQHQALIRNSPTTVNQTASAIPKTWRKPNEGISAGDAPQKEDEDKPMSVDQPAGDQALQAAPLSNSPVPLATVFTSTPAPASSPEADGKLAAPEENGEAEMEPMRNGAGHTSETESSDSGATPGDKENSTGAPQDIEDLADPSGTRQYDRAFLLDFQFTPACTQKTEGHPVLPGVVLDQMNQNKLPSRVVDSRVISRGPDFTPASADFGRQKKKGRGAPKRLINIGVRGPPPRRIINLFMLDNVQLKKSKNAWKPSMKRKSLPAELESQRTQDLFTNVRSILNKLTPENFNQLMKQVTDWTIDTEERLKGVVDLVFEKAIDEASFSGAYGKMCRCLATLKVPTTDKPNNTVNFHKLLLNRCQKEFEKDKVDDVAFERKQKELDSAASVSTERDRLQVELQEAKDIARRRSIGNIKFISELFKLKMLSEAIMHDCVVKLLMNPDQESLECLCQLLTTIGKDLDFEKAKPQMDHYFNYLKKIVKHSKTSYPIRFMLQDIIDLRLHNWVSRRADQGPKTIAQIHQEAKIEEQEEKRRVQQLLLSNDTKRQPDDAPKLQPVVQKSSSPGLVQPEAPVAALQPQASIPAYREASSETLPSDMRPQVPIAAALAPMAPVAVVPVTLSSSPAPALPIMLPPGLPPLVQATTEADEPSKSMDTKDLVPKAGREAQGGITDSKTESQHQALIRNSPTTVNQTASAIPKTWRKPNEGISAGDAPQKEDEDKPMSVDQPAGDQALQAAPLSNSPVPLATVFTSTPAPASSPEADGKLAAPEENGEAEMEPMRNGAGHTSETESSDSGATPGDKENSTGAPQDIEDLADPSGTRQYDRAFLLDFQFTPACTQKPEGLPVIPGVVLDQMNQNKLPSRVVDSQVISRGPDFTPASADFGRQRKEGRGKRLINIGVRGPPPRRIINLSVLDNVQLKKSENAWKPSMKRKSLPAELESQRTQDLFKKVRSILNKLTPENFNQLMKQVTDWTIDTEERLKGVIDLVFEKAIDEASFSGAYGKMCRCLATLKVPTTDKPNNTVNFHMLLLNRCQKEFEKDKVDDVAFERKQKELDSAASVSTERDRLQVELQEAKDIARRRSIGNIKFISELFKLKMLSEAIMHDCVVKLLMNPDQESLECLCKLLTTIGKDLDFEKAKPQMDHYFNYLKKIAKHSKTSYRIRFMLQDIIDLRLVSGSLAFFFHLHNCKESDIQILQNLLRMFFDCLCDEDVISEDAFYKWETSKDPAEKLAQHSDQFSSVYTHVSLATLS